MTIIAIISALGAPALLAARDQFIVDAVAEELISAIRVAQNKAISIQSDKNGNQTKVWGVEISNDLNNFDLVSIYFDPISGQNTSHDQEENISPYNLVDIDRDLNVYFSTPFGKGYVCTNRPGVDTWIESVSNQEKDWIQADTSCGSSSTISLTYKNQVQKITIKPNGDVYAGE